MRAAKQHTKSTHVTHMTTTSFTRTELHQIRFALRSRREDLQDELRHAVTTRKPDLISLCREAIKDTHAAQQSVREALECDDGDIAPIELYEP